jgi:DNA-binding transcriptional regulator YhcF (GntR family)
MNAIENKITRNGREIHYLANDIAFCKRRSVPDFRVPNGTSSGGKQYVVDPGAAIGIKSKRKKKMYKIDEQVDKEKQQRPEFKELQRRVIAEIVDVGINPETAERLSRDHGFPFGDLRNDLKQIDTEVKRYIANAKKVGLSGEEACKLITTKWDEVS